MCLLYIFLFLIMGAAAARKPAGCTFPLHRNLVRPVCTSISSISLRAGISRVPLYVHMHHPYPACVHLTVYYISSVGFFLKFFSFIFLSLIAFSTYCARINRVYLYTYVLMHTHTCTHRRSSTLGWKRRGYTRLCC